MWLIKELITMWHLDAKIDLALIKNYPCFNSVVLWRLASRLVVIIVVVVTLLLSEFNIMGSYTRLYEEMPLDLIAFEGLLSGHIALLYMFGFAPLIFSLCRLLDAGIALTVLLHSSPEKFAKMDITAMPKTTGYYFLYLIAILLLCTAIPAALGLYVLSLIVFPMGILALLVFGISDIAWQFIRHIQGVSD